MIPSYFIQSTDNQEWHAVPANISVSRPEDKQTVNRAANRVVPHFHGCTILNRLAGTACILYCAMSRLLSTSRCVVPAFHSDDATAAHTAAVMLDSSNGL